MEQTFKLYFDEVKHKYTDIYGNAYTSVTTLIGKYKDKFDSYNIAKACSKIGKNPNHPDYAKYKGKSTKQILSEWETIKNEACDKGNIRHNYFEDSIKNANGYRGISGKYINNRIYTVPEIINNPDHGKLDISYFEKQGVRKQFPLIFDVINLLTQKGYLIYAEVGVFDLINLISGLIDVFMYNPNTNDFIIIDWKTNNAPIKFESGYFKKDRFGNITNVFIPKSKKLKYPINHLDESKGNEYSLQLSTYAYLASKFNIKHVGNILFHITHNTDENNLPIVYHHKLPDLTNEVKNLIEHHSLNNPKLKVQGKLFTNSKEIY